MLFVLCRYYTFFRFFKWCRRGFCTRKFQTDQELASDETFPNMKTSMTVPKIINGHWSSWSAYGPCSCQSESSIRGLQISSRTCTNPKPENGGTFCEGSSEKYVLCSDSELNCSADLSGLVEKTCLTASLIDSDILPFGDAQNTSTCQIQCFKAGSKGGSQSKGWHFPDGTKCGSNVDQFCVKGQCKV